MRATSFGMVEPCRKRYQNHDRRPHTGDAFVGAESRAELVWLADGAEIWS